MNLNLEILIYSLRMELAAFENQIGTIEASQDELSNIILVTEYALRKLDFDQLFSIDEREKFYHLANDTIDYLKDQQANINKNQTRSSFILGEDRFISVSRCFTQMSLENAIPMHLSDSDFEKLDQDITKILSVFRPD